MQKEFNVDEERKKWALDEEKLEENIDSIFALLSTGCSKSNNPRFILVGGQAGSGKSGLVAKRMQDLKGNAIIIDQDELRPMYPDYDKLSSSHTEREEFLILNPYIADVIKGLIDRAQKNGYSIILETALQDPIAFIQNAKDLNAVGYTSEIDVMAVPEPVANLSMLKRYCYYVEKDGECRRNTRINPKAIPKLKENLTMLDGKGLFDDISIYIRAEEEDGLPEKVYSRKSSKDTPPVYAFERAQKQARKRAEEINAKNGNDRFVETYKRIKEILESHGEKAQLEKLEEIMASYEKEKSLED